MEVSALKERRLALGYHLEKIAELMKVQTELLERIEESPADTLWQAYDIPIIKRYCTILELDFQDMHLTPAPLRLYNSVFNPPIQKSYNFNLFLTAAILIFITMGAKILIQKDLPPVITENPQTTTEKPPTTDAM